MSSDTDAEDGADGLELLASRARRVPSRVRMRVGVGASVLLLLAALVVTVVVSVLAPHGTRQSVDAVTAETGRGAPSTDAPTGSPRAAVLYVHVLGAVARPGLYELAAGTRVVDAVSAAGGFTQDAEQGGVNLARLLSDGEQLVVPKIGDTPAAGAGTAGAAGTNAGTGAGAKINLNTATEAELETLPRVGPAMAARIMQWRADNGRFTTVDDLMNVTGIGDKTFAALKDLVTT